MYSDVSPGYTAELLSCFYLQYYKSCFVLNIIIYNVLRDSVA